MPQVTPFPAKDATGNMLAVNGKKTALNQTAAGVIKTGPGRLVRLIIQAPGSTSGAFTVNDSATTGAAAAANQLWTLPYNGSANVAGAIFNLDIPFTNGLVISAVPGGGSPAIVAVYE